jgi:hypothetical protein
MKTLIAITLTLFAAGCTMEQFGRGMVGTGQGMNQAYMLDMQMRQQPPAPVYYPQQNNSNYWQEQRAKQEYLDRQFSFPDR